MAQAQGNGFYELDEQKLEEKEINKEIRREQREAVDGVAWIENTESEEPKASPTSRKRGRRSFLGEPPGGATTTKPLRGSSSGWTWVETQQDPVSQKSK